METKFYRDQFEQMLKETADSFRMYPSRKIWHSIYNDIHPARKWPSFAVLLLLTVSIMYIGVTNPDTVSAPENNLTRVVFANNVSVSKSLSGDKNNAKNYFRKNLVADFSSPENVKTTSLSQENLLTTTSADEVKNDFNAYHNKSVTVNPLYKINISSSEIMNADENDFTETALINPLSSSVNTETTGKTETKENDELSWKEDMAFYARQQKNKARLAYQVYATPSVGFRTLTNTFKLTNNSREALIEQPDQNEYFINHTNSLNLEFGGNILYSVNNKLRLKAGVQMNITSYLINAFILSHPVSTNLLLKDENSGLMMVQPRSTLISNSQGLANNYLNNSTFQFSVPLGADVEVVRYKNLKLIAGATIQPTYVSGGNAYLLSSDLKNYVNDPSMIRKFNLNGGVETFVSYQLKNGVSLNAGPQLRYQFLSTYNNQYSYSEKLYNFGVKFGITSRF